YGELGEIAGPLDALGAKMEAFGAQSAGMIGTLLADETARKAKDIGKAFGQDMADGFTAAMGAITDLEEALKPLKAQLDAADQAVRELKVPLDAAKQAVTENANAIRDEE